MSMLPLVSMGRFDDQPAEAAARKKATHRIKMMEALNAALREYHRLHPISPAAEKAKQAELAAANEAYLKRPHQPVHIEYSEALNDGPAEAPCSNHSLPAACRDTK